MIGCLSMKTTCFQCVGLPLGPVVKLTSACPSAFAVASTACSYAASGKNSVEHSCVGGAWPAGEESCEKKVSNQVMNARIWLDLPLSIGKGCSSKSEWKSRDLTVAVFVLISYSNVGCQ